MRPVRIEMEGFSAFRETTVVDFTDAELFAFVGPTGAGKSSVIDAIIFALYGSVPRLDAKLVHPVITQGKLEAKVRFDFEVGGVGYTAVRVVRRTSGGASTKEARLERGDDVLAADVRSLNAAVAQLLGLDLDQFTKCVVLPQGAFAALLHETRKNRQDLLVKLLDLGVYGAVAQAARRRVSAADHRVAVIDEQLDGLARTTDEAIDAAAARIETIETLIAAIVEAGGQLEAFDDQLRTLRSSHREVTEQRAALADVRQPEGLDELRTAVDEAMRQIAAAESAERAATAALQEAEQARAEAGDAAELARQLASLDELAKVRARISEGEAKTRAHHEAVAPLEAAASRAAARAEAAATALDAARLDHAAADLARHLHVGDDCPVCGSRVEQLPTVDASAVEQAEAEHAKAIAEQREADGALAAARRTSDQYDAKLAELREQEAEQAAVVADQDRDDLLARQQAIAFAERVLTDAREADRIARAATDTARTRLRDHQAQVDLGRRQLQATRDRVAALGPPPSTDDLVADWSALAAWAEERLERLVAAVDELSIDLRTIEKQRDETLAAIIERAGREGVQATDHRALRDAGVAAAAAARHDHERLVSDRTRVAALTDERAALTDRRAVLDTVARRLHPDSFQKWLLGEALTALVAGASQRLEELSSGRYGLVLDDDEFAVVDHANADEQRMARTLSGGETFLASLALALALAERVTELSATARASLDAIFLDEGFGTLDAETLDVVASAIEELGATGRMVGLVSHVRDLAERVPVRFEVRPGVKTSTVERVEV